MKISNEVIIKNISELKDHPLNDTLYDKDSDNRDKLRESLLKSLRENGFPNKEIVYIDKNGTIYSGHRRKWASEEDDTGELTFLRCSVIEDHELPSLEQLDDPEIYLKEIQKLDEFNEPDVVRPQTSWFVLLKKYFVYNLNHIKKTGKEFNAIERNKWCREKCSYSTDNFKMMVEIWLEQKFDLIAAVENGEMSIKKAWTKATNAPPPKQLNYDPDRKNWVKYFKNNPESIIRVNKYANDMIEQYKNININGRKIPLDKQHGHEQNVISGNMSHFYMSAMSIVLEEDGFKSITPREEAGLPDIRILDLSKEGYHPERIEVKCAKFNGHGSETKISAGPGATRIVPHTFFTVIYDPNTDRRMAVLSDLTKDDWTTNKQNTKSIMGMNVWADNHLDDCVFFQGDGFIDTKNVFQIQLAKNEEV